MKYTRKIISVILVLVICVVACACSGNNENSFLTNDEWKSIIDEDVILTLNKNGTGKIYNREATWEKNENSLIVEYSTPNGPMKYDFLIMELNGVTVLLEKENNISEKHLLLKNDNYQENLAKVKEGMISQAEDFDFEEFYHNDFLENKAKAALEYNEKIVKWTAKVYDIDDDSCTLALETAKGSYLPLNPVDVSMPIEYLVELTKFDVITIVGFLEVDNYIEIGSAFVIENKGIQLGGKVEVS